MKAQRVWTVYFGTIDDGDRGAVNAERGDNVCVMASSLLAALPLAIKAARKAGLLEGGKVPVRARYELRVDG